MTEGLRNRYGGQLECKTVESGLLDHGTASLRKAVLIENHHHPGLDIGVTESDAAHWQYVFSVDEPIFQLCRCTNGGPSVVGASGRLPLLGDYAEYIEYIAAIC